MPDDNTLRSLRYPSRRGGAGRRPRTLDALDGTTRPAVAGEQRDPDTIDYGAFFRALWRHKALLLGIAIGGFALTAVIVLRLPPQYVAHAMVALGDPYPANKLVALAGGTPVPTAPPDAGAVQTEVEMMKSPALAAKVIRDLGLLDRPELRPAPPLLERLRPAAQGLLGAETVDRLIGPPPAAPTEAQAMSMAVDWFSRHLRVVPKDTSRMLDVAFDSNDPELAKRAANALADAYLRNQLELRSRMAQRVSDWLRSKIAGLQDSVHKAEDALERYRAQAGLFSTPGGAPLLLKEMTDVSAELAKAQTARAALEAQLVQLRPALDGSASAIGATTASPLLRTLQAQEADAAQRLVEAMATQGPKNPVTMGISDRLRHVRAALRAEARNVAAGVEEDLKVAQRKEKDLAERVARLQAEVAKMNGAEVTLRALEREAQAERLVLTTFMSRFKEASQESDVNAQKADAQVVAYAQLPTAPEKPNKGLLMFLGGMGSLLLGMSVAFAVEKADKTIREPKQIESLFGLPILGMIPVHRAAQLAPSEAARYGSDYREALKALFARLFSGRPDRRVVLVSSALPGEGKTTLALSLAAVAAQSGQRTLFIDADFWRNGAATLLGLQASAGLAEVLEGRTTAARAIVTDVASGADTLFAGRFRRGSLLSWAHALPGLLDALLREYDMIVFDGPPALSVAEATLLGTEVDATLLAIRAGVTETTQVQAALRRLREGGATIAGAALTMVRDVPAAGTDLAYGGYASGALSGYGPATGAIAAGGQSAARLAQPANANDGRAVSGAAPDEAVALPPRYALLILDAGAPQARSGLAGSAQLRLNEVLEAISASAFAASILVIDARLGKERKGAGIALDEQSGPVPTFRFTRPHLDAFEGGRLEDFLRRSGVNHLFLAGTDATGAVCRTARSALSLRMRVTFVRDAIVTAHDAKWARLLREFEDEAAFAVTSDEFLDFSRALERARFGSRLIGGASRPDEVSAAP